MRAVVQRVTSAQVTVEGEVTGKIAAGLCVLLGVGKDDGESDATLLADKIANLRIFEDGAGKMNLSLLDSGGALLAVSQFTLYGDTSRGRPALRHRATALTAGTPSGTVRSLLPLPSTLSTWRASSTSSISSPTSSPTRMPVA